MRDPAEIPFANMADKVAPAMKTSSQAWRSECRLGRGGAGGCELRRTSHAKDLASDDSGANFQHLRQTKLPHGRGSMLATVGYITPEITGSCHATCRHPWA